ncbi:hypothetical protein BYT27DRAFT_7183235 [Phlegmacium glaucopus]|nr:hypothetical protein BYT27DRAFT_7183235 [Phlegmacium glaucopus]
MSVQAQDLKLLQERQFTGTTADLPGNGMTPTSATEANSTGNISAHSSSTSNSTTSYSSSSTSTNSSPPVVVTTVAGNTIQVTVTVSAGGQASASNTAPAEAPLEDRAPPGPIFGLIGVLSLIFLIVIASHVIKRRRKKKLSEEAVPAVRFDPMVETDTMRKQRPSSYETDPPPYRPYPTQH